MALAQDYDLWSQDLLSWLEEIKTISDEKKKVQALACFVAELLPSKSDLLKQSLDIIDRSITEQMSRSDFSRSSILITANAKLLANIASELNPSQPKLIKQVLDIIEKLDYQYKVNRVASLVGIAPHLSDCQPQLLEQFLNLAEYQALTAILANLNLSESWRTEILQRTLEAIEKIDDQLIKVKALASIAAISNLSESQHQKILQQIFNVIDNIYFETEKTKALIAIIPYLEISHRIEVLQTVLDILSRVEYESDRCEALVAISTHVDESQPQLREQVFKLAEGCGEINRVKILVALAATPNLRESECKKILEEALALTSFQQLAESHRFAAIVEIIPWLKKSQTHLLEKALKTVRNFQHKRHLIPALAAITHHLNESQQREILQETLNLTQKIEQDAYRVEALGAIASAFRSKHIQLLPQFLDIFNTISGYPDKKLQVLAVVATHTSDLEFSQQAIDILKKIISEGGEKYLATFISHFQDSHYPQFLRQILDVIQLIKDEEYRFKALTSVAAYLDKYQFTEVLEQALKVAEEIENEQYRTEALVYILNYLNEPSFAILDKALILVHNNEYKLQLLATIAPHLSEFNPHLLQKAINIAADYDYGQSRPSIAQIKSLTTLASNLTNFQIRQGILQQAFNFIQEMYLHEQLETFMVLVPHINKSHPQLLVQAYEFAEKLESEYDQAQALAAIFPYLTEISEPKLTVVFSKILQFAQKRQTDDSNSYEGAKVLAALVPHLADNFQPNLTTVVNTILQFVQKWQTEYPNHYEQVETIIAIVPYLEDKLQQAEVLEQTLDLVTKIYPYIYSNPQIRAFEIVVSSINKFQPQLLEKALDIAPTVIGESSFDNKKGLITIFSYLHNSSSELIKKAINIAENISSSFILEDISPNAIADYSDLIEKYFELIQSSQESYNKNEKLIAIVPYVNELKRTEIIQQILDTSPQDTYILSSVAANIKETQSPLLKKLLEILKLQIITNQIEDRDKKGFLEIVSQLASRFPEEVAAQIPISTALKSVGEIEADQNKVKFISALAPRLSSGLFPSALRIITESIIHPAYRTEAFSNLAPYIPREQHREALELIDKSIPGQYSQKEALCNLIPYLYISKLSKAFDIAVDKIQETSLKACIIKQIAISLQQGYKNNVYKLDEVKFHINSRFQIVQDVIKDETSQTNILVELISCIDVNKIFDILNNLNCETDKAKILTSLVISANLSTEQLSYIKHLADNFRDKLAKSKVIASFLKKDLNNEEFEDISSSILTEAYNSPSHIQQTEILTEYAIYARSKQHKALRAIRELNIPILQCKYLERLVPYLQLENILEAQSVAQEIQDEYYKVKALIALASKFPQFRTEAKTQAQDFKNKSGNFVRGIELLSGLAIEVPEILPHILKDLERKKPQSDSVINNNYLEAENELNQWEQKQILTALKPHLPLRIVREIDRERKNGRIPDELWYRSLKILRKTYRDALSGGSFRNDTDLNQDLLNLKDEIDALADMLLMRDLEPPVTVGILGGWGGGKSYIMHLMQNRMLEVRSEGINENEAWNENPSSDELYPYVGHIYQIKFDAWTYAKSHLWASLMQTIFLELDRQITLEQQLIAIGIKPCAENSAKVWQVLYQANDDDRKWFLERVLTSEQLQNLQTKDKNIDIQDSLWQILTKSQQDAIVSYEATAQKLRDKEETLQEQQAESLNLLNSKKQALQHKKDLLQIHLRDKEAELKQQQDKIIQEKQSVKVKFQPSDKEKHLHLVLGYSAVVLESTLGTKGFQKIFDEKIQAEVNQKLKLAEFNIKPENVTKLSSFLKGIVTVAISNNYQSITLQAFQQWTKKNRLLITIFLSCLLLAVLIPVIIHFVTQSNPNILAQLVGFCTPILPAIATLQGLIATGKKWYTETQLALNEYKTSYEQALENRAKELVQQREQEIAREIQEDKSISIINAEITALQKSITNSSEILEIEQEIANIETQIERDENLNQLKTEIHYLKIQLEKQQQELPENKYASLGDFISDRLQDDSYEKQLGIIHQIKKDLADLSYKILPPPIDSKEYASKIRDLKKAFPRGPARVILYIDDLDRCPPETVVEVLEAVQLLVKNRLFIAVLAIDERYINRALAKQYQGVLSRQGRPSPADYLEKIIQIPYRVTPITDSALRQYLKAQVVVQDSATSGNKFNEFSPEEFDILVQCCQEVDLSPRSLKRLTNVYKLFKVLNRIQGHKSTPEEQQAILALLAFSGRYPDLMRDILQDIERRYEESRNHVINDNLREFFQESLQKNGDKYRHYTYIYQESQKLKHDIDQLIPEDSTLEDIKEIFNFVRRFSFVGDIGYDADKNECKDVGV